MNLLEKYSNKKLIFMTSFILTSIMIVFRILSGVLGGINADPTGMSDIESMMNLLSSIALIIQLVFYVILIISIVLAVLAGFYFFKKDKKDYPMLAHLVLWGLNGLVLLLAVPGVNAACGIFASLAEGDYSMILGYSEAFGALSAATTYLTYFGYITLIIFIVDLALFLVIKKVINLSNFTYSLDDDSSVETVKDDVPFMDKLKDFIKSKNGKITLGVIGALLVIVVGYNVYNNVFNYTTINVFDNIDIRYTGESGQGRLSYVSMGDIEYDRNDSNIASFIRSIDLDYDTTTDLKNGDKVTIYAQYDKDRAEELHIRLSDDTKEFTVEGLTEVYSKASDVPSALLTKVKTAVEERMKRNYADSTYSTYKYTPSETYFVCSPTKTDYIYMTYILEQTIQFSTGDPTVRQMIIAARAYPINSDLLKDDETVSVMASQLSYDSDTSKVEETILSNINYGSGDYTITKF